MGELRSAPPRCAAFGLALVLFVAVAPAAEIDSVTHRGRPLRDAGAALEGRLAEWLREGALRANEQGGACDPAALYDGVRGAIGSPFIGHGVAEGLNRARDLDSLRVPFEDSVYRDLRLFEAVSVHWKDLSAVVQIGPHRVGVDKLGHFLAEGWKYFEIAEREGIEAALDWGEASERNLFGLLTTGIYSYADLAANFEGLRFWRRLLGAGPDPLGRFSAARPYVSCRRAFWLFGARRWQVARTPRLADYVSPAWDEAQNCSAFRNEAIEARVARRIAERSDADGRDYRCPIDAGACAEARERYGPWAERLLHPRCLSARPPERPWWRPW